MHLRKKALGGIPKLIKHKYVNSPLTLNPSSRNHVDGMGFYVNGDGDREGTNLHFNKPYLIRKWLPHYDWVLWLDMDALVVDVARPIEKFIEEVGGQVNECVGGVVVRESFHFMCGRVVPWSCLCTGMMPYLR